MKHRLNPGYVKDRVNPTKRMRKLEPHCHRTQNLGDAIWPNEPGCQLTRRHPERQVLGGKPYFLTTHVLRSRSPVTISRYFGPSGSPGQDLLSPSPGATTPMEAKADGTAASGSCAGKRGSCNPWNIERETYLWTLQEGNCGNTRPTVAADSRSSDYVMPGSGEFKILVGSLGLPISLRVKT